MLHAGAAPATTEAHPGTTGVADTQLSKFSWRKTAAGYILIVVPPCRIQDKNIHLVPRTTHETVPELLFMNQHETMT
jgi:hypothetical protein